MCAIHSIGFENFLNILFETFSVNERINIVFGLNLNKFCVYDSGTDLKYKALRISRVLFIHYGVMAAKKKFISCTFEFIR